MHLTEITASWAKFDPLRDPCVHPHPHPNTSTYCVHPCLGMNEGVKVNP
jgi:hypothetical protein